MIYGHRDSYTLSVRVFYMEANDHLMTMPKHKNMLPNRLIKRQSPEILEILWLHLRTPEVSWSLENFDLDDL